MRRPDPPDWAFKAVSRAHINLYRSTGGALGGRLFKMPVLLLTTTGRKSGQPRTQPLTYFTDGDDVILVASKGGNPKHPAWYLNLTANPTVEVERGRTKQNMTARTADPDERARLWPMIIKGYAGYGSYQDRVDRQIPVVILTPA